MVVAVTVGLLLAGCTDLTDPMLLVPGTLLSVAKRCSFPSIGSAAAISSALSSEMK